MGNSTGFKVLSSAKGIKCLRFSVTEKKDGHILLSIWQNMQTSRHQIVAGFILVIFKSGV